MENTITDIYIETDLQLFINLTINISDILTQNNKLLFTIYNDNYWGKGLGTISRS